MNLRILAAGVLVILIVSAHGLTGQQTATRYDYNYQNRALVIAGEQASFICYGLFVSNRTMDQLYEAELKMDQMPLAPPDEIQVDRQRKTVAVGGISGAPVMRAAYREGLGCV